MKLEKMDDLQIQSLAQLASREAIDFAEAAISDERIKAQRYYDGEVDIGHEEGTSKGVATKVRDTVRSTRPSLMRIFLQTDKPVEFVPAGPEDVQFAEQATKYMHYVFKQNDGYRVLSDVFHDAQVKKQGVVKVYWDESEEQDVFNASDLSDEEFSLIVNEDNVSVIVHEVVEDIVQDPLTNLPMARARHNVKLAYIQKKGRLKFESVPPEEFYVDRGARTIDDLTVAAHRTEMFVSELVEMGFDFDEVIKLAGVGQHDSATQAEEIERQGYDNLDEDESMDPAMREVVVTEVYMKIDVEGTGIAQLHKILLAGDSDQMLSYEPVGFIPFAIFEVDPEPHTFYGRSQAELIFDDQDSSTVMLRGVLNNVQLTNSPRTEALEGAVNMDDLLNNEIGGIVRVSQMGATAPHVVPFIAGQTLAAIEYMDRQIEEKTGVTHASSGLSPDVLQNQTATAVAATTQAQAGQIEVMARNLAEGGMRRLFKLMLRIMVENVEEEQMMRVAGDSYVPVDPRSWNVDMDVSVNVGLGTGQHEERLMALTQSFQIQTQIMQTYGPGNPFVSMSQIRNTIADMLSMNGLRNTERYYKPLDEQTEQQFLQQMAQGQDQGPDPQSQAFIAGEQIKAQSRERVEQMKLAAKQQNDSVDLQLKLREFAASDDLARDKMDQELIIKAAEILGRYGSQVDTAAIKQAQAAPREL